MSNYPEEFMALLESVTAKRPYTVVQHILKHGYVTSQELKELYGYNHPPRAVRDVREYGIPIITNRIVGTDGRKVAAYKFGNPNGIRQVTQKATGRTILSKHIKKELVNKYGARCYIYMEYMDEAILQIDHRIPYEISGEQVDFTIDQYMLLSPSANRMKSWACENCINWEIKDVVSCKSCFWAYPEKYTHVAGVLERVVHVYFSSSEIELYERLVNIDNTKSVQDIMKHILSEKLKNSDSDSI